MPVECFLIVTAGSTLHIFIIILILSPVPVTGTRAIQPPVWEPASTGALWSLMPAAELTSARLPATYVVMFC